MRLSQACRMLSLAIVTAVAGASAASAKTCKEPVTATSRSQIKQDEAARTRRATDNATKRWAEAVRAKYGLAYRFWLRSENQNVECKNTPKTTTCTVTATPCRLL